MLTVSNVSVRFGDFLLFENINFIVNPADRIGLVGPNGAGKSTLLNVVTGITAPDSGSVHLAPGARIGYLRQGFADIPEGTLADILDIPAGGLFAAHRELEVATHAFSDPHADLDMVSDRFQTATDQFEALGGYAAMANIQALLDQFGLGDIPPSRQVNQLSGGQKTRAGLAALLATGPDVLILDEPTNHLDTTALRWLSDFLNSYQGAFILVSHDRAFLDDTVNRILAIDPRTKSVSSHAGNYSAYARWREHEAAGAEAAWHRQQVEVARIQKDIRAAETKARSIESNTIDYAIRKKAAKIARPAVVRKKKLERLLQGEDVATRPERSWGMSLDLGEHAEGARDVVWLDDVNLAYEETTVLEGISQVVRIGDRVAVTGDNGTGKTTLVKAIAGVIHPTSGEIRLGPGVKPGYLSQEQETLDPELTVLQQASSAMAASETDIRNELHKFLFGGDTVHKRVGDLSYGERARLMLALLALKQTTLLLLDEPLNHLDIDSREEFEQALQRFRGTIIMVLHDRYSIDRLATREWRIQDGKLIETVMPSG